MLWDLTLGILLCKEENKIIKKPKMPSLSFILESKKNSDWKYNPAALEARRDDLLLKAGAVFEVLHLFFCGCKLKGHCKSIFQTLLTAGIQLKLSGNTQ